jgi:arylsulfatase A-like enzyme
MNRLCCALLQIVLLALWSCDSFARAAGAERADRRPNIVFIFVDDMGYADPSCFGNPMVNTPHMDRLAVEGIRLTNFYSNSPICSPSRVAVTTGQYPGRWKIHSYLATREANRKRRMAHYLALSAPTVAKSLKAAGYATAHFGKWHMGGGRDVDDAPEPSAYGFDEHLVNFEGMGPRIDQQQTPKHKWTEIYVDRAIDFIRRNQDTPFFLRLFPNDVHDRHEPATESVGQWTAVTEDPTWQRFFAVLEEMDRQIGRLVVQIDSLGLAEQTLILLTSDNGPTDWPSYYRDQEIVHPPGFTGSFFGRKWSLYEGGIRMPLIARWKGRIASGATNSQSIVAGIDLPVIFRNLAGVPVAASEMLDGIDMTAALLGQPIQRPRPIFWQYGKPFARLMPGNPRYISPSLAMRDGRWKLLMNPDGSEMQLFDVVADVGETNNLADDQPQIVERMRALLLEWYREIGYPSQL